MLQRELSYQVPFRRLTKLCRSAARKAYRTTSVLLIWVLMWLLLVALFSLVFSVASGDALSTWIKKAGGPYGVELAFVSLTVLLMAGILVLRSVRMRPIRDRVDYDEVIRLTQDKDGLRFATANIEHYLKWPGISQLMVEHDGVVISHGNLFFLVPSAAFANEGERLDFIRDIFGRLSEKAQAISRRHVGSALERIS